VPDSKIQLPLLTDFKVSKQSRAPNNLARSASYRAS